MPGPWTDFGMQAAQDVVGAGLGLALGQINDKRQLKQQGKLQKLQIQGQKEMTSYNQAAALKMWQDTNYGPQMEQLKKAGLNPGLIYGMSAGGGTTAAVQGGNVTGAHAPTGGGEAVAMGGQMMQLGLMRAQKENIEADTANKRADIPVKDAQVPNIQAHTQSLLQGIQSAKAQQKLTEIQTEIAGIQLNFDKDTFENRKSIINIALSKMVEEVRILENEKEISEATKDEKIKLIEQELAQTYLQQLLTKAQTAKTATEQQHIGTQIQSELQMMNIKSVDEYLAKGNINPKDPFWARSIQDLIQRLFGKKKQ